MEKNKNINYDYEEKVNDKFSDEEKKQNLLFQSSNNKNKKSQ